MYQVCPQRACFFLFHEVSSPVFLNFTFNPLSSLCFLNLPSSGILWWYKHLWFLSFLLWAPSPGDKPYSSPPHLSLPLSWLQLTSAGKKSEWDFDRRAPAPWGLLLIFCSAFKTESGAERVVYWHPIYTPGKEWPSCRYSFLLVKLPPFLKNAWEQTVKEQAVNTLQRCRINISLP